ncbi:MAG: HDOD domain-containing protein [Deltaproteobacteria bacterium]|nr:HDOD domain-containing protein [Deltaproteobacteria bacterium]
MEKRELHQKIYAKIEELPTLPVVLIKLLSLIDDPRSNATSVTELISRDPSLTAKLLKVANSAYYGFPAKISDLKHAVALLGFNMVKSLAVSIGIIKIFPRGKQSEYFSAPGLWLHSLLVATAIQELRRCFCPRDEDLNHLFVVGLLHDLGKVVFDQFFPELFTEVLEKANIGEHVKLHWIEREIIGIDHCEVSAILLTRWKFPPKIVQPIAWHHRQEVLAGNRQRDTVLLRIANVIAQELGLGKDGNAEPNPLRPGDLEFIGASEEDLLAIKTSLQEKQGDIEAFFAALG